MALTKVCQILFMIFSDLHLKPANVEINFEVMTSYSSVLVTALALSLGSLSEAFNNEC